jgi:hypothetical protein
VCKNLDFKRHHF